MKAQNMSEPLASAGVVAVSKVTMDTASYGIVFATVIKVLPPLAALISILWIGFQFYHSEPMKEWRKKRKENTWQD